MSNDVCFRKMAHEIIPAIITDSKAVQPFTKYLSVPEGKLVSILLIWVDLSSLGRAGPHLLSAMRLYVRSGSMCSRSRSSIRKPDRKAVA
jgi:hypothetical protein